MGLGVTRPETTLWVLRLGMWEEKSFSSGGQVLESSENSNS